MHVPHCCRTTLKDYLRKTRFRCKKQKLYLENDQLIEVTGEVVPANRGLRSAIIYPYTFCHRVVHYIIYTSLLIYLPRTRLSKTELCLAI